MTDIHRWLMLDQDLMVVNVVLWDGQLSTWTPPEGITMQQVSDDLWGGPGNRWNPDTQQCEPVDDVELGLP